MTLRLLLSFSHRPYSYLNGVATVLPIVDFCFVDTPRVDAFVVKETVDWGLKFRFAADGVGARRNLLYARPSFAFIMAS
jgi:hypothetical protein